MSILFYKSNAPHGALNNFRHAKMFLYGHWWNNVEAAYQSRKTLDLSEMLAIKKAASPREARNLGQKVTLRSDWEMIKDQVMYECVLAKFTQHHDLRTQLLNTGSEELIEDSPIDAYWGRGIDGTGKNMLGQILMRVRSELRE